ncbi:MAG: M3 family oligoendopeptidase [Bacteroidetes bacterium]|nr:M3 family oligoendopeptidase [Bacteroidota bacterium]
MPRHFIPEQLTIETREDVISWYESLANREIQNEAGYRQFLADVSELESAVSEDLAWRYIRMTCDTTDKEREKAYLFFVQEIQPHLAPLEDKINNKIVKSPFAADVEKDEAYRIYLRGLRGAVEIFREENVPLQAELASMAQEYAAIQGAMSIEHDGKTITMQQAGNYLMDTDRAVREVVWKKMFERRNADVAKLETLFDAMVQKRHQVALNAGFSNFRDYMFKALGRYDYTVQDCLDFHQSVETCVVPLLRKLTESRRTKLGLDKLRPWDLAVDAEGRAPLKPFSDGADLLEKSLVCLQKTDPFFAECLQTMKKDNLLDLESRIGKAPGGYNYPLAETNKPFIFMNASGNLRDVETLVHEAGHAVHSFLMAPLELNAFKNTPSEVAELASMSMELLTMDAWDAYLPDATDLNRAKREQLEGILATLPWIAQVDAFQHWIYTNPEHTAAERAAKWLELQGRFGPGEVDYSGCEDALKYSWHKQLHIFEIPFYYIEYGFAQLGALGVWMSYCNDAGKALGDYKKALKLGYTRTIPEMYTAAGPGFDFSEGNIKNLFRHLDSYLQRMN